MVAGLSCFVSNEVIGPVKHNSLISTFPSLREIEARTISLAVSDMLSGGAAPLGSAIV